MNNIHHSLQSLAINIDKLSFLEGNPRQGDVEAVAKSYKQFGQRKPIVATTDHVVIAGNHQLAAARQLGWDKIAVVITDDDELTAKAFALADNRTAELGSYDDDLLADLLSEVSSVPELMDSTGFTEDDLFNLIGFDDDTEEEEEIEVPVDPKTKLGDMYKLGNHYLLCGDATNEDDVKKLIENNTIDLVFTDPPYGMKKEKEGVLNDNLNYEHLLEFNKKWISITFDVLKDNGSWYCWGIDEPLMDIYVHILKPMIKENKITFRNLITWDKNNGQGQNSDDHKMYARADEKCLFVITGVQGFNTNSDNYYNQWDKVRLPLLAEAEKVGLNNKLLKEITGVGMYGHWFTKSQWTLIPQEHYEKIQNYYKNKAFKKDYKAFKKDYEAIKKDYQAIKKDWYETRAYFDNTHENMNNVWHFNRTSQEEKKHTGKHATPKPLELCKRAIKSSSRIKENVFDLFGGSGSTLIACEQIERNCYMMELDPVYCDVIIERWENLTGQKAELIEKDQDES